MSLLHQNSPKTPSLSRMKSKTLTMNHEVLQDFSHVLIKTDIDTYKHTHTHTHTHLPLCLISSLTNLLTYSAPGAMASVLFLENSGSLLKFEGEWIHLYVWLNPFTVHLKLS